VGAHTKAITCFYKSLLLIRLCSLAGHSTPLLYSFSHYALSAVWRVCIEQSNRTAIYAVGPYRTALLHSWQQQCAAVGIPYSESFSLATTLSSAVEMREWAIQGLPSDAVSTENGILVTRGHRWPLMIDPQDQANRCVSSGPLSGNVRLVERCRHKLLNCAHVL
jgi:hypothetical protein